MRKRYGFLLVLLLVSVMTAAARGEPRTIRLLTVGNSFADNALTYLPQIVEASGNQLIAERANVGGCSLERHWGFAEKYEADHEDKAGRPYRNKQFGLAEMLGRQRWDVVTIQQASWLSHDAGTFRPWAKELYDYIHQRVPGAKILMQQTWAYRADDARFGAANTKEGEPHTQREMYEQVRTAYHTIAGELGIGIIPSGDAMWLADSDATWGYKPDGAFDFAKAQPPALPDQTHSLHGGWHWSKQKDQALKLEMDGHHANKAGCYLIGCVWFEVLYGQSVADNRFVPEGLDAEYAKFLREAAHRAVEKLHAEGR